MSNFPSAQRDIFHSKANEPHSVIQYAITPRYLAGGGDPRHVTEVLQAAGWTNASDPSYPHVLLASPDLSVRLVLEPEGTSARDAWWKIHGYGDPHWYARFGGQTPAEIIAGFTDALIAPTPSPASGIAGTRRLLTDRGWSRAYDREGVEYAVSPDGHVRMGTRTSGLTDPPDTAWFVEAEPGSPPGHGELLWSGVFSEGTPAHAVAAFARALSAPDPVYRGTFGLPCPGLVVEQRTDTQAEQLVAEHRARLNSTGAAARRQHRQAARPPDLPSTAPARQRTR
jgi:hypothetical protein